MRMLTTKQTGGGRKFSLIFISLLMLLIPLSSFAQRLSDKREEATVADKTVGKIRGLRGTGIITRRDRTKTLAASVNIEVLLHDMVAADAGSRVKVLFLDDSMLTVDESSKVSIEEYVSGGEDSKGRSILNLIDGRIHAVAGRNKLEVHSPTAVAAPRGTVFAMWEGYREGEPATFLGVLEGNVDIRNINPAVKGRQGVAEGYMTYVAAGRPPVTPFPIPDALKETLNSIPSLDTSAAPDSEAPPETGMNVPVPADRHGHKHNWYRHERRDDVKQSSHSHIDRDKHTEGRRTPGIGPKQQRVPDRYHKHVPGSKQQHVPERYQQKVPDLRPQHAPGRRPQPAPGYQQQIPDRHQQKTPAHQPKKRPHSYKKRSPGLQPQGVPDRYEQKSPDH